MIDVIVNEFKFMKDHFKDESYLEKEPLVDSDETDLSSYSKKTDQRILGPASLFCLVCLIAGFVYVFI